MLLPVYILLLGLQLSSVRRVSALECLAGWNWTFNSLGQNPCTVTERLEGSCLGIVYTIPAVSPGSYYTSPNSAGPLCQCNTVLYSTLQACALCQNGTQVPWSVYKANCSNSVVMSYPINVPTGAAIPHWAYLNVTVLDQFSPAEASAAGDRPEVTPTPTSTTTTTTTPTSFPTSSSPGSLITDSSHPSSGGSPTLSSSSSPQTTSKPSSNTGAIVGGTVGGVCGLSLIIGAIAYLLYRRRQVTSSNQLSSSIASPSITIPSSSQHMMQYNPDDPNTYPSSMAESSFVNSQGTPTRSGYRGHPEI